MYAMDVEDLDDDEEKDEGRTEKATGPNPQSTRKPLMTQNMYYENNLRHSEVRYVESTSKAIHTKDGSGSIFVDGQLTAADRPTSETNGSKNVYEKRPLSSLMHSYRTSLKGEGIWNDIRETNEGEENLQSGGESRLNPGRPKGVVSFQSTSGEYSVSKSTSGDLLVVVDGKLYRHVKEV